MRIFTLQFGKANAEGEFADLISAETVEGGNLTTTITVVKPIIQDYSRHPEADIVRLIDDDGHLLWVRPRHEV